MKEKKYKQNIYSEVISPEINEVLRINKKNIERLFSIQAVNKVTSSPRYLNKIYPRYGCFFSTFYGEVFGASGFTKPEEVANKALYETYERTLTSSKKFSYLIKPLFVSIKKLPKIPLESLGFTKSNFFESVREKEYGSIYNILDKTWHAIPTDFLFWSRYWKEDFLREDRRIAPYLKNTNGCAAGKNYEEATVNAILEVIERDALLIRWISKIPPNQIDPTTLPEDFLSKKIMLDLISRGISAHLLNLTLDIEVPIYGVCLIDSREGVYAGFGSSAGFNHDTCITKAINEALNSLEITESFDEFSLSSEINRKIASWKGKKVDSLGWFLSGATSLFSFKEREITGNRLDFLIEKIKSTNSLEESKIYVASYSPRFRLKKVSVVKVFITGLVPFFLNESAALLNIPRLVEACKRQGVNYKNLSMADLGHPLG